MITGLINNFFGTNTNDNIIPQLNDNISETIDEVIEDEKIENNKLIIDINEQINISKKNIECNTDLLNKEDEKLINELKIALREIFTNSKFMIQKVIKKNKFVGDDYYDLNEQLNNLEELNQMYSEILLKYK